MSATLPSLLQWYKLKRKYAGENCIIQPFHKIIARSLTDLVLGKLDRPNLMILMPPRMGKTDLGDISFTAWAQSYFPDAEHILTAYASDLAITNTKMIRGILTSDWYDSMRSEEFGCHPFMSGDTAGGRQDFFHTMEGGSIKGVGMGSGITGFGAGKLRQEYGGCIMIDDPLKAQDYKSAAMRLAAISYINNTLKSRRNNQSTPLVLIMQRLHPNDPAGMLLKEERDKWTVIQIPALDENNKSIWEERISTQELLDMKEANPELFWGQYQQNPTEANGCIFKPNWWRYWHDIVQVERRITLKIITADTAFSAKDSADFTVYQCWGFEGISGAYLIDSIKGRWEFPDAMRHLKEFWSKHNTRNPGVTPASELWIENKASGQSIEQTIRRETHIPARAWEPNDKTSPDKVGRANQCTMPISTGRVYLPNPRLPGYQWVDGFINEHESFTNDDSHLFDDQVDTETMALLIWQQRGGGRGQIPIW